MLRYCANLKAIRYESTNLNRIVADKSHRVIVAQGRESCTSMSDHIKQLMVQEFFAKKVSFSWNTAKLDSFVLSEWKKQKIYRNYVTLSESRQRGTLF